MTNDSMPESYRKAFHACLVRSGDWMTHGGPEPECYLENQPYPASTFFDFMTKFAEPMRQIDCQLALKIMGGVLEDEQADIQRDQSYGNAAKHLVRKIKDHVDYKREQARLLDGC